jgi:hypothetical protein
MEPRYSGAVDSKSPTYVGGFNTFRHYSEPITSANHDIVTPNNDTLFRGRGGFAGGVVRNQRAPGTRAANSGVRDV